jgi:sugar lactone lactonase YvrE
MKWIKGAKEGIVVAGGHGNGNSLRQLDCPLGMTIDQMGNIYVADCRNDRIMCWPKGSKEGRIVVGGKESNQFNCIQGLSFDRQGNLYVVDRDNNRVQRFDVA